MFPHPVFSVSSPTEDEPTHGNVCFSAREATHRLCSRGLVLAAPAPVSRTTMHVYRAQQNFGEATIRFRSRDVPVSIAVWLMSDA